MPTICIAIVKVGEDGSNTSLHHTIWYL